MNDPIQYTATPRHSRWKDLSDKHAAARKDLSAALEQFSNGDGAPVINIVGAYGSGKSELMAWGFRYCWRELGIPALFINLETLLKHLPDTMTPSELPVAMADFMERQLFGIGTSLQATDRPDNIYLATDLRPGESYLEYFDDLFEKQQIQPDEVYRILERGRGVLFLDEIEQRYGDLFKRVMSSDHAPLREMLQQVEQGIVPFYLVLSFGLTSAYEAMSVSGADARRLRTITLPIPDATELQQLEGVGEMRNLIWWSSRGRPGWAVKLGQDWGASLPKITTLEGFRDLEPAMMESLPLIDVSRFSSAFASTEVNRAITHLLKSMRPIAVGENASMPDALDLILAEEQLRYQVLFAQNQEDLVAKEELLDAFIGDITRLAGQMAETEIDWQRIRYYLGKIVAALSDSSGNIALGHPRKIEAAAKAVISPLLTLLQDLLLEYEGDQQDVVKILNFLDKVMEKSNITGEEVKDAYMVIQNFDKTEKLFREVRRPPAEAFVSLSPKAAEALFPRIVGRPLLTISSGAKSILGEQRAGVEASVQESGKFLEVARSYDSIDVRFVFVPSGKNLNALQRKRFARSLRHTYLDGRSVYVLYLLDERNSTLFSPSENIDDFRFLRQHDKLQLQFLGERRLQDFVISLWHNWLESPASSNGGNDPLQAIDWFLEHGSLRKANRRKLSYYRNRLEQTIEDFLPIAARDYQRQMRILLDLDDPDFPAPRLRELQDKVKDNRTIEEVALAFDVFRHRDITLETLRTLRQLHTLRDLTKQPHAYKEFLETYSVSARGQLNPAASLSTLSDYIRDRNGMLELVSVADSLSLDLVDDSIDSKEGTDRAPLRRLFGSASSEQDVFLRGVSLHTSVQANRDYYEAQLDLLDPRIQRSITYLEALKQQVNEFNASLQYQVLSIDEIEGLVGELRELLDLVRQASTLPAAVCYVLFRFTTSALQQVEELRQKWAGYRGLDNWRAVFHSMLGWKEMLAVELQELEETLIENRAIKGELLDQPEQLRDRIRGLVEQSVDDIFGRIELKHSLNTDPPDGSLLEKYDEARMEGIEELDSTLRACHLIDNTLQALMDSWQRLDTLVAKIGGIDA